MRMIVYEHALIFDCFFLFKYGVKNCILNLIKYSECGDQFFRRAVASWHPSSAVLPINIPLTLQSHLNLLSHQSPTPSQCNP